MWSKGIERGGSCFRILAGLLCFLLPSCATDSHIVTVAFWSDLLLFCIGIIFLAVMISLITNKVGVSSDDYDNDLFNGSF